MNTNAIILKSLYAKKPGINRPAILSATLSVQHRTQKKPAGYISALAHEVRNPLCNINLALGMLKTTNLDEEQTEYINIIMRGRDRINDLINKLLLSDQTE